jgi:hypothetical protein
LPIAGSVFGVPGSFKYKGCAFVNVRDYALRVAKECNGSSDGVAVKPNGLVFVVGFGCTGIASSWTIASEWIFVRKV